VTHANSLKPAKGLEEILEPFKQFVNPDDPEGERAILDSLRIEPEEQPQEVERANITESDLDDVPSNLSDIMSNPNYLSSLSSLQENSLAEPPLPPTTPSPSSLPPVITKAKRPLATEVTEPLRRSERLKKVPPVKYSK